MELKYHELGTGIIHARAPLNLKLGQLFRGCHLFNEQN